MIMARNKYSVLEFLNRIYEPAYAVSNKTKLMPSSEEWLHGFVMAFTLTSTTQVIMA